MTTTATQARLLAFALFIGALLTGFVAFNAAPLWLMVDIVTDAEDGAQVFYSPQGAWSEAQSATDHVHEALSRTLFRLPTARTLEQVRFDPGRRAATYHILGVRWIRGFMSREVSLDTVTSARDGMPILVRDGHLEFTSPDNDPQLLIALPDARWQMVSLMWPAGVVVLAVAGLVAAVWRRRISVVSMTSICLAIAALFYCVIITLRGAHLPMYDDLRYVLPGQFNLVEGGFAWMRVVGNDTYFLTGQLVDFATLALTDGNFEILRLVALALLMVQLWLTQRVLLRTNATTSPWLLLPAVALVAWSLAANSYWGATVVAYHQFLPVLCGTLLLFLLIGKDGQPRGRFRAVPVILVCLASGLSYISGGLMLLCLSLGLLLAQADLVRRAWKAPTLRAAWLVGGLGTALLALQLVLVTRQQGSLLEHSHAAATVLPNDHRFWLFACAQFGRAMGYSGFSPLIDAGLTFLALFPTAILAGERVLAGFVRGVPAQRPALLALALYAGIAAIAYASIVAFGRAGFGAADAPVAAMIDLSKGRFHYWPVAALLPFLWLGWVELALRWGERVPRVAIALVALAMLMPKSPGAWDLIEALRFPVSTTTRGALCIATQMHEDPLKPFICQDISGGKIDLSGAVRKWREHDNTLYRQIERYEHTPLP